MLTWMKFVADAKLDALLTAEGVAYLIQPYKQHSQNWEVTVLVRKVLLAVVCAVWPSSFPGTQMRNKPDRFDFVFLANCSVLAVQGSELCFPVDMKLEIKNKVPPTVAGQYSWLSCVGNRSWRFITFQHCWTWPKVQCHDAIRGHWHDPFGFTGNHFAEISICLRGLMSCGGWGCVRGLHYLIATLSLYIYIHNYT